jgi:Carboxypeptidase regulatory-like domain
MKKILSTALMILVVSAFTFSQSRETGAITGKVTDEQGAPLPGVNLTLTGPTLMGTRTFVSDANGDFRFPALPPGTYAVKAELQGFGTVIQERVRLTTTTTLTLTIALKPATVAEEVTVIAKSPTVDVKSSETASVTLSNEILRNIPFSQFSIDIVNMAPGVYNDTAFGASNGTGISWQMDGVGVGDPAGGTAWVFLNANTVEEAKVMGIGLPAEYGGFTGVIFNLVTKSGGNKFSGHFETLFQGQKEDWPKGAWSDDNLKMLMTAEYLAPNYGFDPVTTAGDRLNDVNFQLGGPIVKDKLWFYLGAQYSREWYYAPGFGNVVVPPTGDPYIEPVADKYREPRGFFKLTSQLGPKTNLGASFETDFYYRDHRTPRANVSPEATVKEDAPNYVGSFNLTHIFSPNTFMDVKGAFFTGNYALEPRSGRDVSGHYYENEREGYPLSGQKRHDSYGTWSNQIRTRYQVNASVTHYAENFLQGSHEFKFGVEVEHSIVRDLSHYTGANSMYYDDYWGYFGDPTFGNYYAYQYEGYDVKTKFVRAEVFAQDSWQVTKRLNVNLGLRFTQNWGSVQDRQGTPWNTSRIAPRIGFTFDVLGDKTTILKAHYGQYTEAMYSYFLDRLNNNYSPYIIWYWWPDDTEGDPRIGDWYLYETRTHGVWNLAPGIKHPYLNQYTVGIERELFKDTSFSVTYINREWKNPVGSYDNAATWDPYWHWSSAYKTYFQIFERTSDEHEYVIGNLKAGVNGVPDGVDVFRKYWGWEFLFNKRFSNRWQLLASYVYSKAYGTLDNAGSDDIGYGALSDASYVYDPNFFISGFNDDGTPIFAAQNATNDPTHMIKIQGTYVLPFDISFNAYFHAITGDAWGTRVRGVRLPYRVTYQVEPRGTHHYEMDTQLDVRLEKTFTLAKRYKVGVIFDVFNVFNANSISSWGTRAGYDYYINGIPSSTQGHQLLTTTLPRRARLGLRLTF